MPPPVGLLDLLRSPASAAIADFEWNLILAQGRKTQLLGQLAFQLRQSMCIDGVPPPVRRHLELWELTAQRRAEVAMWEVKGLRSVVESSIPIMLLKGCAYVACGDACAGGRIFSDIDILVRRTDLPRVELELFAAGWKPSQVSDYDRAYYRDWMHEVPPMEHVRRHTTVDLHHAINPPVSPHYVDPEKLWEDALEIKPGLFVLGPTDRVIHCALHLLQEGDVKKLLRELHDLYLLNFQFHKTAASKAELQKRALTLGVWSHVQAALTAADAIFSPSTRRENVGRWLSAWVVQSAVARLSSKASVAQAVSDVAVLAHSHLMKMPLTLLIPHLAHKLFRSGERSP